jgi:ribonuclease D
MSIISKTKELEEFCASIKRNDFITIDTEFSRETTYYPKLCLIQIASENKSVIIDTLSSELNISVLNELLQTENIVKVFHSAKQDLEILYQLYNQLPKNIFDTQIAASFCGFGDSVSYESLVWDITSNRVDKSYCLSDWSLRPLMDEQIEYALGDVTHLRQLYLFLHNSLQKMNRLKWAIEDINDLNKIDNFVIDPQQAWRKIKDMRGVKMNLVLKKLAAWREIKARKSNLPRNHYLHEKHLFKLYEQMPINLEELQRINYFKNLDIITANEIVEVIKNTLKVQSEEDLQEIHQPNYRQLNERIVAIKALRDEKASEHNLPAKIIATTAEIKALCGGEINTRPLKGWRQEIFGKFITY